MNLNVVNEYDFNFQEEPLFVEILQKTKELLKIQEDYVFSCVFVDDNKIQEINREYRHIDRPTDVISFALLDGDDAVHMDESDVELGDIFINIDAAKRQALEYEHSFKRELCFLFTHGLLHLLGYDHIQEDEEKVMNALQQEILNEIISR